MTNAGGQLHKDPLQIVGNLIQLATKSGASSLRIEGTLANPRLLDVLTRRYKLQTSGATDSIVIVLQE